MGDDHRTRTDGPEEATAPERRQARQRIAELEEAQHQSEALWRTLIESSPDFVMLVDLEGRIQMVNRTIAELTRDQIIGTHHLDFLGGDSRSDAEVCFAQVLETRQSGSYEVEYPTGTSQSRHFDTRVGPVIRDGEITSFVVTATDITERRQAEEARAELEAQVLHSQKLESLGLLAGGIAHDFNNLLMGIIGNAELVHQDLPRHSETRERIEVVIKTARRCAELANHMLAYSGKGSLTQEPIDLRLLLADMPDLLRTSMADNTVFEVDLAEGLPSVEADASQIHQVVMNLVINAAEAVGDERGVVSLALAAGQCDGDCACRGAFPEGVDWPSRRSVVLTVSDTGCGMDGETQKRLFDPFFTTKFTGRGLGLAAVYGILRGHKAGIVVTSEPGAGSTISVHFPAVEAEPVAAADPVTIAATPTGTILVVDDERLVRDVVAAALKQQGFEVLLAVDGVEGVEMFREQTEPIACVILDVKMPRMGGEEALVELRKIRPDVLVLLTSGYPEEDAAERFVGSDLAGFIQKPFSIRELEEKLTAVLAGGTGWSVIPAEPD